ncbi:MAG: hypothetical protein K8S99_10325 [Planctomycetes bacterium]|nr:hypothetical protein [Planctomycetota bacterium]
MDVDEQGWLWEGVAGGRLAGHNVRTGAFRILTVPEFDGRPVYSTYAWHGKLVLQMGQGGDYLVLDPDTGRCVRRSIPGSNPILWYGAKLPGDKVLFCDRGNRQALILDAPEASPRAVPFPYEGDFGSLSPASDGIGYVTLADPARLARFDIASERFIDEAPMPWPEAGASGRFEHGGVIYFADSAGGRLLPYEMRSRRWLDPIPTPDHGKIYGFIGIGLFADGLAYFSLSTYAHRSQLDLKTGKIIMPPPGARLTVDGRPLRFMERMLVFDPVTRRFDYLTAPAQPDGVPLLCYTWTDGKHFAVTGCLPPFAADGGAGPEPGPWIVLQSPPITHREPKP